MESTELQWALQVLLTVLLAAPLLVCGRWWCVRSGFFREGRLSWKRLNLPPGTMGWPIVGEQLEMARDPSKFGSERYKRYGEIYKTHLARKPTVVITSPEAFKFVQVGQVEAFQPIFPNDRMRILGPRFLNFTSGDIHLRLRKLLAKHLVPEALKHLVPDIEKDALAFLKSWGPQTTLPAFRFAIEKYVLSVSLQLVFGSESRSAEVVQLQKEFTQLERGFNIIFPINIPGTRWHRALKSRQVVVHRLEQIISSRRDAMRKNTVSEKRLEGFLDSFIAETEKADHPLPEEHMKDNVIGFLFASNGTTSISLTWVLKFLHDLPHVLEAVKAEQEHIRSQKKKGEPLNSHDIKNMTYTSKVLLESWRMANILPSTIRVAVQDVEYKGFVIPKGWQVMPTTKHFHMDPNLWPDPQKFDPSRFETTPGGNFGAFGAGPHLCVGNELARLEILIFLHHLTTNYRWEVLQDGPMQPLPFPSPYKGLPLKVTRLRPYAAPLPYFDESDE